MTGPSGARHGHAVEALHRVGAPYQGLEDSTTRFASGGRQRPAAAVSATSGRKINLSQVSAGQKVGVKQPAEHVWLVSFMDYDLVDLDAT